MGFSQFNSLREGNRVLWKVFGVKLEWKNASIPLHHGLDEAAAARCNKVESFGDSLYVILVVFRHDELLVRMLGNFVQEPVLRSQGFVEFDSLMALVSVLTDNFRILKFRHQLVPVAHAKYF